MTADEIQAFAKLTTAIAEAHAASQKQLAQSRNKTLQAQTQIRDQVEAQVKDLMQRAGVSEQDYRRKTYIVSTDSTVRAAYDMAVAKLTGAPLPGRVDAATSTGVKVPDGPVGQHIAHITNAFTDTPNGQGLLTIALSEAGTAMTHAALAGRDPNNLAAIKLHVGHVLNALDPTTVTTGPGLGYGVKRASLGVATHAELAAKAQGASTGAVTHAGHVASSARNSAQRVDQAVALAQRILATTVAADAAGLLSQLTSLTNEIVAGKDLNSDGRVSGTDAEGGLQQCAEHVTLLLAADRPTAP
ncbi:MAG TPA: hypothetical protein VM076_07895 [Gemmatimonadaceae bacterium]|nr:hypothetical protein [Gemmatimonadaceae bacterium]